MIRGGKGQFHTSAGAAGTPAQGAFGGDMHRLGPELVQHLPNGSRRHQRQPYLGIGRTGQSGKTLRSDEQNLMPPTAERFSGAA